MDRRDFFYELPRHLIAQEPRENRADSRLMVLGKESGAVSHMGFSDIAGLLRPGDCIVVNDSKVIPARLMGKNGESAVEFLLCERLGDSRWAVLARPGKKARPGDRLVFCGGRLAAEVAGVAEGGLRVVDFAHGGASFEELLAEFGEMPLPRYIKRGIGDGSRYQTVYAEREGSIAAPTAGLHFTDGILEEIRAKKVGIAKITLHVGLGTFRPVKADDVALHHMHSESFHLDAAAAGAINRARRGGGRVLAVGTTSCRAIESCADESGRVAPRSGKTDIFIYPGYRFKATDGLLTNFHLPESTLIMLVSALAGRERVLAAYGEAVRSGYRFYSFGDAMLVV